MARHFPVLLVLLFSFSHSSSSDDGSLPFRSESYGVEHGLSQSSVWSILQDRQGFLWIATADGLNRFDGYSFRIFRHIPTDSTSLSNNNIWALCQDKSGSIWVGTRGGLHRYDPPSETFTRLFEQPRYQGSYLGSFARTILEDHQGVLWIGTVDGLAILNPSNGDLKQIPSDHFQPAGSVPGITVLHEDDGGIVWLANSDHLFCYDRTTGNPVHVTIDSPSGKVAPLFSFKDHKGIYWFATRGHGAWSFDPKSGRWESYIHDPDNPTSLRENSLRVICEDNDGRLWIGTVQKGICYLDRSTGQFHSIKPLDEGSKNTRYEGVPAIIRDRSGLLWVGFDGGGLVKLNPYRNKFRHVLLPPSSKSATGDNFFKAILVDHEGNTWLGMYDQGLSVLKPTGEVKRYSREQGLSSNSVFSLLEDRSGNVWIGTAGGLDEFDRRTGRFRHHDFPGIKPGYTIARIVGSLAEDSLGLIWCGTGSEVYRSDRAHRRFERVFSTTILSPSTLPPAVTTIAPATGGNLWIGTLGGGMLRLRVDGSIQQRFVQNTNLRNSLSHNNVKAILIDHDGTLWVGTEEGLNHYDPSSDRWKAYRTGNGLPNDFIYGILMDNRGHLWISTNRGLSRMDAEDRNHPIFRNYTPADGLQSFEFNTNCYFETGDGHMLFAGVNGFNMFHPDSLEDNPVVPGMIITGFKKFDQPVDLGSDIASMTLLTLDHSESVFSFEFSALEFTDQKRNQYAYMMEGFDPNWIYCGSRREARYTNLDPGSYVFHVKGSNNDGLWNDQGTSILVTIVPPFWKTAWFLTVMTVTGVLLFGGGIRYVSTRNLRRKIDQLERAKQIQDERLKTRERIARDLHDDLASTVGSAGLYIETVRRQLTLAPAQAREFLDKTGTLLSEAKDAINDIVWSVSPRHDTLESLLARIRILATDLCRANGIGIEIDLPSEGLEQSLPDEVRRNTYLILKEALTNSVRHSNAKSLRLSADLNEKSLAIELIDDGCGFDIPSRAEIEEKDGHTGNGIRNMRQRAEEIQADLVTESAREKGTAVRLSVRMTQMRH